MIRTRRCFFIYILLFAFALLPIQKTYADTRDEMKARWRAGRDHQRLKHAGTESVMELLGIRPGITILDLGTGTGQFAFEFAKRLEGTGKVFATDIDASCINYVKEEAARRGLANLYPVLVSKEGLDGFYSRHKYDLITLFHVNFNYEERVDYFRELKGFLAERGQLVLIFYKGTPSFSLGDFTGDFKGLIRELSLGPAGSPFYKNLREATKALIKQYAGAEPGEDLKSAIVDDFNRMLSDNRFGRDFVRGSFLIKELDFSPEEREFVDWALLSITYKKIFNREKKDLSSTELKSVTRFNKLLLLQRFRQYLAKDKMFISGLTPPIKGAFEKAGYKLGKEYNDAIPFEDIIFFTAAKDAKGK